MSAVLKNLKGLFLKFGNDSTGAYAAQVSYFLILSFIPFVLILAAGITLTPLKEEYLREVLYHTLPADFYAVVLPIIRDIFSRSGAVLPISILMAFWSSGKVISSLTNALNIIFGVKETRGYIVNRLRGTLYILIFIVSIFLSMVFMVFGNILQEFLIELNPDLTGFLSIFTMTSGSRNVLSWLLLTMIFLVIYLYIPNRKTGWKSQLPGAMVAATAWILFSWLFSLYVSWQNGLTSMYGSLTTIIFFLTWLYFCMWIVMIGAELNSYYEAKLRFLHQKARAVLEERKER